MWELGYKESWAPKNWFWTVVLEKTLESPLDSKEIQPVHPKGNQSWIFIGKGWCWSWNSNPLATWCKELTHLKKSWGWKNWRREEKGWMASLTQWTWVWVHSGSWWWTGRPGVLQSMWSQRVGHDWETELNWSYVGVIPSFSSLSPARSTGPYRTVSSPFLPDSLWIFLYSFACRKVLSPASWSSSVRGAPHVVVFLTCSWWEMSSASAYLTISSSTT